VNLVIERFTHTRVTIAVHVELSQGLMRNRKEEYRIQTKNVDMNSGVRSMSPFFTPELRKYRPHVSISSPVLKGRLVQTK